MTSKCINCLTYHWPVEGVPVFRCASCKFVYYCSRQCQKEHWVKLHKKQCKTLAGKVKVPVSTHLPDSCPGCKEEKELGTKTINSQDCPVWGCLIKPKNKSFTTVCGFPSAVELGEMVRKFSTRAEHTVYMMQLIVNKLTRTRSRLARECQAEMTSVAEFLTEKRSKFMLGNHYFPTYMEKALAGRFEWNQGLKLAGVPAISTISRKLGPNAGDPYCAWETLKLLVGFLVFSTMNINYQKDFEQLSMKEGLPGEVKKLFDQLGTSTQFEELWDKVLAALESGLVDHANLVEIICGGSRHQRCGHCKKSVIVEQVLVIGTEEEDEMFKKPFVTFRLRVFSCLQMDCMLAGVGQETDTFGQTTLVMKSKILNTENTCDYCFMIGKKVHRCGECKTKVYCSEECQLLDWNLIHSKLCNKGDVARKVKGGKKLRESAGKKQVEEVTSLVAGADPLDIEPHMRKRFLDVIEQIK